MADLHHQDPARDRLVLLAVDAATPFDLAAPVEPPTGSKPGTVWAWGSLLPDGRIFLIESC